MLRDAYGNAITFQYDKVARLSGLFERTICYIETRVPTLQIRELSNEEPQSVMYSASVCRHYKDKPNKEIARRAAIKAVLWQYIPKRRRLAFWALYFSRSELRPKKIHLRESKGG